MKLSELRAQREAILTIAAKHGATNVRVFGSVARDEATDTSDVDFLVDLAPNHYRSWWPAGFIVDLEDALGQQVDVATPATLYRVIRDRVLHEAISL